MPSFQVVPALPATKLTPNILPSEPAYAAMLPTTGHVRLPIVKAVTGLSRTTIYRWGTEGRFPKPTSLSPRVSVWSVAELRRWLADPLGWQTENQTQE